MVYLPTQVSKLPEGKNYICLVHHVSLATSTEGMNFWKIQKNLMSSLQVQFKR